MKKAILASILIASAIPSAQASLLLSDSFSYPDGVLTAVSGGLWVAHSSAGSSPVTVLNGVAVVKEISVSAEDIHMDFSQSYDTNSGVTLYSSYTLTATALPTLLGTYATHYRDTNSGALTGFGARVWLSATNVYTSSATPVGKFRIGIANGNASGPGAGQLDVDLDTNVTYTVVTRFVLATGTATLWINPAQESDPSITATDISTNGVNNAINVVSFCFRQGAQTPAGSSTNLIDNLKIGTAFSDVAGNNTAPLISGILDQSLAANTASGAIPFTVSDGESAATSLIVSGTSSNTVLVPNNPANITFGGAGTNRTITITPAAGQQGTTEITVSVTDGVNNSSTKFLVRVGVPAISAILNQLTVSNVPTPAISFTIGDAESPASSLNLSGASSNPTLVTTGDIGFGGSGSNRTVTITPEPGQTGVTTITIYVDDGVNTNSTSFVLNVRPLLGILFSETFSYPDGSLWLVGPWTTHASPTGTNFSQMIVTNGTVQLSRSEAEDLAAALTGGPYAPSSGVVFYTGFKVLFTELPSNGGNYFIHLKDAVDGTTFRAKVFASTTNAASGKFRLGISTSANIPSPSFPRDLSLNHPYIVVTRYVSGTAETKLWINPSSEASQSVSATDNLLTANVNSIGLRQDTGIGTNYLDNLIISGSAFADVIPTVVAESLQFGLSGGNLVLTWTNPLLALQSASTVDGPYTDVVGAVSPYSAPLDSDQKYFRLKY